MRLKDQQLQLSQGLYDPLTEHDNCGIGFIAHMKGEFSHSIVDQALTILERLEHRGACGCEENTGDGAGITLKMPHEFFKTKASEIGIELPDYEKYGSGLVFFDPDPTLTQKAETLLIEIIQNQGQVFLGFRDVPIDSSMIGQTAKASMPKIKQVFIGLGPDGARLDDRDGNAFERRLYLIRKVFENRVKKEFKNPKPFYMPSLSSRTFIYKGMLISFQLRPFFLDLKNPELKSCLALVHSRFSTNTFPSWHLAQPFRYLSHNGEINTLRGNQNWMKARQALFESELFGDEIENVLPVIQEGNSDSASFDNALEILVLGGYSLPHAMMMTIPEAYSKNPQMDPKKRAFYEYHATLMEPWDGPASIAFTDGRVVGAVLDRNGLRPSRYYVTDDDVVIMGSEVGVVDVAPEKVVKKGRLQPGRMFLVDLNLGRIITDQEIKDQLASEKPYADWLKEQMVDLADLPDAKPDEIGENILQKQITFGYTHEDFKILMQPMAETGMEAIGSMGTDTPLAVLSNRNPNLFQYFKQLFAQVTNPPLDAIREELVTSVDTTIGAEQNLLMPDAKSAHHIRLQNPILDNAEMAKLKALAGKEYKGFQAEILPMVFDAGADAKGLEKALNELFAKADQAIAKGVSLLILSDRMVDENNCPIPSLLATAGLHHHLVKKGTRAKAAIVVESAEPREVHHFCLLIGYGAGAINPYLALDSFQNLIQKNALENVDFGLAVANYKKASKKGIVKVMSKIGVSTIQSYRGAQIFEAIGLNQNFVDQYFCGTTSKIEGIGLDWVAKETQSRFLKAYPKRYSGHRTLDWGGEYKWRRDGSLHLFNPETVSKLQHAVRFKDYALYQQYAKAVNDQAKHLCTLRGLMKFKDGHAIPIEEVESVEAIVKRFKTGAMSYGSISAEAHETLAIAMNRLGGKSNTGEGGEDARRFQPDENGDLRRSAIKQVASGRFGVTSHYLVNADEIQIKIAQGAKPGEGGQLPGKKVYPWIAKVRHSTPGVGLISPPPHHDIYSIEDLAQLIFDLKNANHHAGISVKLVSEVGVGTVAAGVAKAHADLVLISGYDGGTGASPLTSLKHAGGPWELGLAETQQVLVGNRLRDRIRVEVDGQMKTGRDVAIGILLGAEEFGFSTAPLVTLGCIMMRACHLNTCPVGIATQDPKLRKKFEGNADRVVSFFHFVAQELREIMASLGYRTIDEMVGRSEHLDFNEAIAHYKTKGLDYSRIFYRPELYEGDSLYQSQKQDHGLDKVLDNTLIEKAKPALENKTPVKIELPIKNTDRTTATMLGSELTRRHGVDGLAEDTIWIKFKGSAGQSLGAFVPKGITLEVEGDANDYVGKGLSGGKIIVYPDKKAPFKAEEEIIIGNVVLYGATDGQAYFRGIAGERFCVRNSGAHAVVEGVGDHCCEYMTGGRVVVLGPTGRNVGAGMSGGVGYFYDPQKQLNHNTNKEMVDVEALTSEDLDELKKLIENHLKYTQSSVAQKFLADWQNQAPHFVKVMPRDYKKALIQIRQKMKEQGISEKEAMYG